MLGNCLNRNRFNIIMTVTYIYHSCYLIEFDEFSFLFDFTKILFVKMVRIGSLNIYSIKWRIFMFCALILIPIILILRFCPGGIRNQTYATSFPTSYCRVNVQKKMMLYTLKRKNTLRIIELK